MALPALHILTHSAKSSSSPGTLNAKSIPSVPRRLCSAFEFLPFLTASYCHFSAYAKPDSKNTSTSCSPGLPTLASSLHLSKGGYAYFVASQLAWPPQVQPGGTGLVPPMRMQAYWQVQETPRDPKISKITQSLEAHVCDPHTGIKHSVETKFRRMRDPEHVPCWLATAFPHMLRPP